MDGCDSIVEVEAHVHHPYHNVRMDTIPLLSNYVWAGAAVSTNQVGEYVLYDSLTSVYGCDSVWELHLYVEPSYLFEEADTICAQELPYVWREMELPAQGIYTDSLKSSFGMDSVYQITLNVLMSYHEYFDVEFCEGDSLITHKHHIYTSGIYVDSLLTVNGCDSLLEYNVVVHPVFSKEESVALCAGDSYTWHGYDFTGKPSGKYMVYDSLKTIYDCDSVFRLQVIISPEFYFLDSATICPGENYDFRGRIISKAGMY